MSQRSIPPCARFGALVPVLTIMVLILVGTNAQAIPLFARQTGQNCLSCHAGGQFPELTPYGRKFKLTGYTMGERDKVPLAVMGVASLARVSNTTPGSGDVAADFPQNGALRFTTASIFAGGKITDNLGLFAQWTWNAYDHQNDQMQWVSHSSSDQFDLRYADRFIGASRDLIIGASLNNNPGVTDVWNTFNSAFTSVPGYVPVANAAGGAGSPFTDVPVAPILQSLGPTAAGMNVYVYWNDTVYAELGAYRTANGPFSFLSQGISDANMGFPAKLKGLNPYWRLALNHDWGPNSAMVGFYGITVDAYAAAPDISGPTVRFRDVGIDGQYQYILDPHMISAQVSYTRERISDPNLVLADNDTNTLNHLRLKATYVYQAKYGASLGYASVDGSADAALYPGDLSGATPFGFGNNTPDTRVWIPEVFWTPIQNVRIGLQYYKFTKYAGASTNYDGNGRNASDNNTLFFYVWGAY
jgi:hypothetical protein